MSRNTLSRLLEPKICCLSRKPKYVVVLSCCCRCRETKKLSRAQLWFFVDAGPKNSYGIRISIISNYYLWIFTQRTVVPFLIIIASSPVSLGSVLPEDVDSVAGAARPPGGGSGNIAAGECTVLNLSQFSSCSPTETSYLTPWWESPATTKERHTQLASSSLDKSFFLI